MTNESARRTTSDTSDTVGRPTLSPSYSDVRCYDADGNLLRIIPALELMRRDSPVPDPDGRVPALAKVNAKRRGAGLSVVIAPRELFPDFDVPRVTRRLHAKERV